MRKKYDNYPSEPAMIEVLLARQRLSGPILEPAAGAGKLAEPLRQAGYDVITNDICKVYSYHTRYQLDVTNVFSWAKFPDYKWVVTNPPYSHLDNILEYSLATATHGVAMILRLSALEPASKRSKRGIILANYADYMRYIMPFSGPRPSFTKDGKTDSVTTAWFVWDFSFTWSSIGLRSPFQFITDWLV